MKRIMDLRKDNATHKNGGSKSKQGKKIKIKADMNKREKKNKKKE